MNFKKIFWVIRAAILKPFFKELLLPSYIGKPMLLTGKSRMTMKSWVRIYPGARIDAYYGAIEIQENVSIGQNLHLISGDGKLIIGKNTTISSNVFITNVDHEYRELGKSVLEQPTIYQPTMIGEECFIGYGVVIQAGTTLGKHCIVGSNSVVRGDFPDNCVIAGVPAKIIRKYNPETEQWERVIENEKQHS